MLLDLRIKHDVTSRPPSGQWPILLDFHPPTEMDGWGCGVSPLCANHRRQEKQSSRATPAVRAGGEAWGAPVHRYSGRTSTVVVAERERRDRMDLPYMSLSLETSNVSLKREGCQVPDVDTRDTRTTLSFSLSLSLSLQRPKGRELRLGG